MHIEPWEMKQWSEWENWEGVMDDGTKICKKRNRIPRKQGNLMKPKTEEFEECETTTSHTPLGIPHDIYIHIYILIIYIKNTF